MKVHVQRLSPTRTDEWRTLTEEGRRLYDVRLQLTAGEARYFILNQRGDVTRHGTIGVGDWDAQEMTRVLTTIIETVFPDAIITVDASEPRPSTSLPTRPSRPPQG